MKISLTYSSPHRLITTMLTNLVAILLLPISALAGTESPFPVDGNVPNDGCPGSGSPDPLSTCILLADPSGSAKELGPSNSSETKLGTIQTAIPPMLAFTNPNSSTDIVNVWLETRKDGDGDIWLYFAWQRDASSGSSVISYEFQQSQLDPACNYDLTDQVEPATAEESTLIASCNPWSGRQADDFMIVWDFGGGATDVVLRTFDGDAFDTGTLVSDPALGYAFAALNGDTSRGEGAINLSDSIFADLPDSCLTVANVIPGTITGNSDQADYKDTVLTDMSSGIGISSCGTVTVTKATEPGQQQGPFLYTLEQIQGDIKYASDSAPPCTSQSCTDMLTGDGDTHVITRLIPDADYRLTEDLSVAEKYLLKSVVCDGRDVTDPGATFPVTAAATTNCTITNELGTGTVTVVKKVVNIVPDNAAPTDFCLSLDGGQNSFTAADEPGSQFTFVDGHQYTVSEVACGDPDTSPQGYTQTFNGACNDTITAFQNKTCTVTNTQEMQDAVALTLFKNVINDNGGTASSSEWTLKATLKSGAPLTCGATGFSGNDFGDSGQDSEGVTGSVSVSNSLADCVYELSEEGGAPNYSAKGWSCSGDFTLNNGNELTVGGSGPVMCTAVNDDDAPSLTLVKQLIKDNGGTAVEANWTLSASGPTPISGAGSVSSDGSFWAGTYTLSEFGGPAGYIAGAWSCSNGVAVNTSSQISLALGQTTTCTIVNDDAPPSLTLVKRLIKDNGGTAAETDWTLSASGPTPISGAGGTTSDAAFQVGVYTLAESEGPAGYMASTWDCVGGYQSGDQITLTEGQSATCTITNDDVQPTLTLVKIVINDDHPVGLGLTESDFPLSITAPGEEPIPAASGVPVSLNSGDYVAAETNQAGYAAGQWGGDCAVNGSVSLSVGDVKTCSITNDDIPPELKIVKTPDVDDGVAISPGGDAVFSMTVTNIGGGDAYDVTLTDTLPSPDDGLTGLKWYTATTGCSISDRVELSCDIGFLGMDPTPEAKESGDENSFTVAVIARIPTDYLFTTELPGGVGTLGSNFEIDGNMVVDGADPAVFDWENSQTVAASVDGFYANVLDPPANVLSPDYDEDNSFGEGTKENDPVPVVLDHSVPPNKSDLTNFLVTQDTVEGNLYLVLGWLRANSLGTSNFDFELNQTRVLSANGATPERSDGDVLISFDFEGTGDDLESLAMTLREWDGSAVAWGAPRDLNQEGTAYGAVNDPIAFGTDPAGEANSLNGGLLLNNTFGEAIVNLTQTFSEGCRVFLSAYVKGRSSTSFTSSLKDFVTPLNIEVNSCRTVTLPNLAQATAANHIEISDAGSIDVSNDPRIIGPVLASVPMMALTDMPGSTARFGHAQWPADGQTYVGGMADAAGGALGTSLTFPNDTLHHLASIHDMSSDGGPELVTLGAWNDGNGQLRVTITDPMSGALINRQFYFSNAWKPVDMLVMHDLRGDGSDDVAVLGDMASSGRVTVKVRDGATGAAANSVDFMSPAWRAMQLIALEDMDGRPGDELGVLAASPEGRIQVSLRDALSGEYIRNIGFLDPEWVPIQAVSVPDYSGNGVQEIGVLARRNNDGTLVMMVRDPATNSLVGNVYPFDSSHVALKAVVLPDENGNGAAELATLASNNDNGRWFIEVRDLKTGERLRVMAALGADWTARDFAKIDDVGGGAPGLSVMAIRKSDGKRVTKTIDALSGELVGHVWLQ